MKRSVGSWACAALATAGLVASAVAADSNDGRYIVKFRDFNGAAAAVAASGGRVALEMGPQGAVAAYLPERALQALRNNPNVEYVEDDVPRYPLAQTMPYGIGMVQANDPMFTSNQSAGSGAMVCIIDSGYQLQHTDLQDNNVTGTDDPGTGNWAEDTCGHGTHVAGTVAALNNTTGVVGVVGSGALRLHIEKVFDGASCGWAYSSSLVTALNRCIANASGKKLVVSMSLGGGRSSTTENNAFQSAYNAGVLPIAAAGNDGSTRTSYPAGYASVVSVAAVDSAGVVADFSQKNADVEIAAPGVGVVSTTPFKPSSLSAGASAWWLGTNMDGSARTDVTGTLVNGGLCDSVGSWSGKVVLCERGVNSFAQKVSNVQSGNGAGAVIYNNVPGGFSGTLNGTSTIPAISLSQEDGQAAVTQVGQSGTLANSAGTGDGYESYDGTSMATPHVSGVAALVWSLNPTKTAAQVREALQKTAADKGTTGRDNSYGYGIVQAKAAHDFLQTPVVVTAPTLTSVTAVTVNRKSYARLVWSGAAGASSVDYFRNSTKYTTANDGTHDDGPLKAGTYAYKVCLTGTNTCSATIGIGF
jgi:serine protease